jgi:hypothetical protein
MKRNRNLPEFPSGDKYNDGAGICVFFNAPTAFIGGDWP